MHLIERIYKIDVIVAKREGVFAKAGKIFNDCRDKFNKSIRTLVNKYKEQYQDRLADELMFIYFPSHFHDYDINVSTTILSGRERQVKIKLKSLLTTLCGGRCCRQILTLRKEWTFLIMSIPRLN